MSEIEGARVCFFELMLFAAPSTEVLPGASTWLAYTA